MPMPQAVVPRAKRAKSSPMLWLVYAAWAVALFDLHFFFSSILGSGQFGRLATLVYTPMMLLAALRLPSMLTPRRLWMTCPPFVMMMVISFVDIPLAPNARMAFDAMKPMLAFGAILILTVDVVKTPREAMPILTMFAWRFLWWALGSGVSGRVMWHPTVANFDAYGGLMVGGVGVCYWYAMAERSRWRRYALLGLAGFAVLGVVASYARGAFLSMAVIVFLIWLRSPRKVLTAFGVMFLGLVMIAGASLLFEDNFFYNEIMSSFSEGTSEGTTGGQRWNMWMAAVDVWKAHPFFGVGAANFGVFASTFFREGEIVMFENPAMLYGFNLHNAYFQILAELGTLGVIAFAWLHLDFFRKNRDLHKPAFAAQWQAGGGAQKLELKYLALALEAGVVAVMLANVLYASLFESWLWMGFAANRMVWGITRPPPEARLSRMSRPVAQRMSMPRAAVHRPLP